MNRIFLIAFVLAASCVNSVTGNRKKFFRLAKCFNDDVYPTAAEVKTCLGEVSTCFDDTTIADVKTCIEDGVAELKANATDSGDGTRLLARHTGGVLVDLGSAAGNGTGFGQGFRPQKGGKRGKLSGVVMGCLETKKECIKEEVRDFIKNKLPACVNTTARAIGECYINNAETCSASCSESDIPSTNPFEGVASANIKACSGFQNRIMNPSCEIVDCCPECSAEFDALMTCVGQDLLQLKPEPCELSCPADSTRRKLSGSVRKEYVLRKLAGHLTQEPEAAIIADECAVYLDTEEETLTPDAVTDVLLNGEFIGCVADVAISVAEEQKEFDAAHKSGGSSSSSIHGMVVTGLAAVFLGLVGLV